MLRQLKYLWEIPAHWLLVDLGTVGIITKHEIVLAITGGLFVLEAVSVMVQVISFKLTGKRIFKMAPIHHHFEKRDGLSQQLLYDFG